MLRFVASLALACLAAVAVPTAQYSGTSGASLPRPPVVSQAPALADLVSEAISIRVPTRSATEYADAARRYRGVLDRLKIVDAARLDLDDEVDRSLLEAQARTRLFEIETLRLHEVDPTSYIALGQTSGLFLRPAAMGDADIRRAVSELSALPVILASARTNLKSPARTWTENARYQAYFGVQMLDRDVATLRPADAALGSDLAAAAARARAALAEYDAWLERELLPRSTRSPAWTAGEIDFYQFVHEQLDEYGVDEMIRIAEVEERQLTEEMTILARQIHPSGDLRTVWRVMADEAPPWDGVLPMAQRYVDMASAWLRGPGRHVVTIPDYIDYGARITPPMARRILSFGGASQGPTVAGRQSGYYVLTPLEDRLTAEDKASRLRSYNPYWTHVISYHEWLGHNVQIAAREAHVRRPMRRAFRSIYFSQAWSFYLEKLLEDEGYYDGLPYMEALKTRMARRQMRMWRVQRILTKCRMAKRQMTLEEAVQAYVGRIGMEPTNAFIEVQRDSQSPSPPGREIIGELVILQLRDEYRRRMGPHYSLQRFHDTLLTYGDLPFRQIRRLMFRE